MFEQPIAGSDLGREPVLGEPHGPCEHCMHDRAELRCDRCGLGGYCSAECLHNDILDGWHVCFRPKGSTAALLLTMVDAKKVPPPSFSVLRKDYFFDKCPTHFDETQLLKVYEILFKDLYVTQYQLHDWMLARQVHKNTVRMFNRHPDCILPTVFVWLRSHAFIFSAREDTSEEPDLACLLRLPPSMIRLL